LKIEEVHPEELFLRGILFMKQDTKFMKISLGLAKKGAGKVFPNPLVGAVLVKNSKIVGSGYHQYFGGPHAEVNALAAAGEKARGADLYVNLEPCAHYGKTPPCTKALIAAGVRRVFVAMTDPNPLVAGKGRRALVKNKIAVSIGCLEQEARELNRYYIHYMKAKRPYVTSKWAMSADGKIATRTGDSKWISNEGSRQYAHLLRSQSEAIIVGGNTVLKDDPLLTVRHIKGARNPLRIVLDRKLSIPLGARILNRQAKTIVVCQGKIDTGKAKSLMKKGAEVWQVKNLLELLQKLANRGVARVLIEGGGMVHTSFLESGLVDKVAVFIAPLIIGGAKAVTPVAGAGAEKIAQAVNLKNVKFRIFADNVMMEGEI
jgi:diaminohydroxyphosphoribosylaminopyrimidine deaminase / 5-amino-6-(5-phosphoribosylamino)uracil reductase